MAPQRNLLQTNKIGSSRSDLIGEQPASSPEIGALNDLS